MTHTLSTRLSDYPVGSRLLVSRIFVKNPEHTIDELFERIADPDNIVEVTIEGIGTDAMLLRFNKLDESSWQDPSRFSVRAVLDSHGAMLYNFNMPVYETDGKDCLRSDMLRPHGETVKVIREKSFFMLRLSGHKPRDMELSDYAEVNPGTLRIESLTGEVLWSEDAQ